VQIPDFNGRVTTPQDAAWDEARQAFNLAVDQRPDAVLHPADASDVAAALKFAASEGLGIAPQSTGHNAGARPVGEGMLLLKMGELGEVEIDAAAKRARVGAGAQWGPVVEAVSPHGLAALHGSSGTVGVAGYSLMGGIGWYARSRGLQTNALTAIELVTADGAERRVDADNDPELFWALRGGGGAFGVVTALEFELFECEQAYAGMTLFPWEHSLELLSAWHELAGDCPDELTTSFRILQVPDIETIPEPLRGGKFTVVDGAFRGGADEGEKLVAPLRAVGEPIAHTWGMVPASALPLMHMDPPEPVPGISDGRLVGRLDEATMKKLVETAGPGSDSPMTLVELRQLGGALARAPENAGALATLDGDFALFSVGSPMTPELGEAISGFLPKVVSVFDGVPGGRDRYLNYSESPVNLAEAFDDETVKRLNAVKAEYDPDGLIRASHWA
jgi:FAD/FMN-containing dehydrogenase